MKKKLLLIIALAFYTLPVHAGTIGDFFTKAGENARYALDCGNTEMYIPVRVWHNRLFYDSEHVNKYNEEPWGFGLGRGIWDGREWHGVYAMGFKDSNFHLQTIFGYAYQYNWDLDDAGDWKIGAGYTLGFTQRHEYKYIPIPIPLPVGGITYKRFSLQASYVPGVKNDGNVLMTWVKWTF